MSEALLACTVRGCGRPLTRAGRALVCAQGHSYDIARSGYVNLLQPQDRRSLDAGDPKDIVAARGRLAAAGLGGAVIDAFLEQIMALQLPDLPQIVDLGCGAGHALAAVAARRAIRGVGVDLSTAAVERAARAYPSLMWVVANADRRLPLVDASVSVMLSMHGRRNPEECARALSRGGHLLVAVPAPNDLLELRAAVQGAAVERDRVDALIAAHAPFFEVVHRQSVRARQYLAAETLGDLLRITYRGVRQGPASAARDLNGMDVTLASDVVVFARPHAALVNPSTST